MGYDIFKFGALYLGDKAQHVPERPTINGDIPQYDGSSTISISPVTREEEPITWIKPYGINILIADRVLLAKVSWEDLDKNGFVNGKEIVIEGQHFRCRLLHVGNTEGVPNEWDKVLNETEENNALWHWKDMCFWGSDVSTFGVSRRAVRGSRSARLWSNGDAAYRFVNIGFRPVLEPLASDNLVFNCTLDEQDFCWSTIPNGKGFCPILQPTQKNVFANVPDRQRVRMYTLLKKGRPVRMDTNRKGKYQDVSQLKLTDRYFGEEYLIPWTISNGIAVADQLLLERL